MTLRLPSRGRMMAATAWLHARPRFSAFLLVLPCLLFLLAFYAMPIAAVLLRSFLTPIPGFGNYARLFSTEIYWRSFEITFRISALVAAVCVLIAYPTAIMLGRLSDRGRLLGFALILIPYWTSALVRTYAWTVILQRRGILNSLLLKLGVIDVPLQLSYTTFGTIIGNVHILLPATILILYASLQRIDAGLVTAARTLGAGPMKAFLLVYLPLSIPAVVASTTLTFVASLGSYIIPALLGGRGDIFIAQLIDQQINRLLDVGFASAISMVLLIACALVAIVYIRITFARSGQSSDRRQIAVATIPLAARIAIVTLGFIAIAFLVVPTFVLIPLSFSSARYLTFPPPGFSLQWYRAYLDDPMWIAATFRSLRIGLLSAVLAGILGTLAAIGLSRSSAFGRYFLFTLFLSPMLVPSIIYALALYQLYSATGLIGTETGLVLAHAALGLPYVLMTVTASLSVRDSQLGLAARTLGAGPVSAFALVQLPQIRRSIVVGMLLAFITSFDEVVIAIFVSGVQATTLPKMMWDGVTNEVNPVISAVSVVTIGVSLLFLVFMAAIRRAR